MILDPLFSVFQQTTSEETSPSTTEPTCDDYTLLNNAIPQGKADAPHTLMGNVDNDAECLQLCCNHGDSCEYAWYFRGKCFSVSCAHENFDLCQPVKVEFESVYIWIPRKKNDVTNNEDTPTDNGYDTPVDGNKDTSVDHDVHTNQDGDTPTNHDDDTPINQHNEPITDQDSNTMDDDTASDQETSTINLVKTSIQPSSSSSSKPLPTQPPTQPPNQHSTTGTSSHTVAPVATPPSTTGNDKHLLYKSMSTKIHVQ